MPPSSSSKMSTAAIATLLMYSCAFRLHVPSAVSYYQHRIFPNLDSSPKIVCPTDPLLKPFHTMPSKKSSGLVFGASTKPSSPKTHTVKGYMGSDTKKLHSKDATINLYVRIPLNNDTTFWFVGKVIGHVPMAVVVTADHDPDLFSSLYPTPAKSFISQKCLILEYAKNQLRPQNFSEKYSSTLESWTASNNSEMDVNQNKFTLEEVVGSAKDLREGFSVKDCGYNPKTYVGKEKKMVG
ncbi:hypothetical protein ACHAWX_005179 [Stephanocyclus meneghinianus]